mgnify:CR=1 FL=1|tara:strand:- start:60 stop:206 length:147 start_codon:yes stop_codon:yes gene_type:complete
MKNNFIQKISILLMYFISISYSQQVTIWGHVSTPLNGMLVSVEGANSK